MRCRWRVDPVRADRPGGGPIGDDWAAALVVTVGLATLAVWSGAQLAARAVSGRWLDAGMGDALGAMVRLPSHWKTPADAWPPAVRAWVPRASVYWPVTLAV